MPRTSLSRRGFLLASAAGAAACHRPKPAGFSGLCFVANRDGRNLAVVDLTRFRLHKQIAIDATMSQVVAAPPLRANTSAKVYALVPDDGAVIEVDAASLTVARRIRAGNQAVSMDLAPGGNALWVLYRDPAAFVEIPLDSFQPRRRIRLDSAPDGFDLGVDDQAAIASYRDRTIALASLKTGAVHSTVTCKDEPSLVQFQKDAKQLIVGSHPGRNVTIFETASTKTVVRLPLAIAPRYFCPTPDGGQVYVTGDGMDAVVIVYPYRTEVAETILAGRGPGAMTVAAGLLLVSNPETGRVTALDVNTMGKKLVTIVDVGQEPRRLFTTPDDKWAFALDAKSGDMAVIQVATLSVARPFHKQASVFALIAVGETPVDAAIVAHT